MGQQRRLTNEGMFSVWLVSGRLAGRVGFRAGTRGKPEGHGRGDQLDSNQGWWQSLLPSAVGLSSNPPQSTKCHPYQSGNLYHGRRAAFSVRLSTQQKLPDYHFFFSPSPLSFPLYFTRYFPFIYLPSLIPPFCSSSFAISKLRKIL